MKQIIARLAALAALLVCTAAAAQSAKPVQLLVPFSPGGTVDIVARQLSRDLSAQLGQNVIVDNRPGAGGIIAAGILARSAPDGSVLMIHHMGATFTPALYDKLPYDTRKDLVPVALIGITPNALVVTNSLPAKNLQEFIAYAKAHPGTLSYASAGVGSASHIAMESLMSATGIRMTHIPYKGGGPALQDLAGGRVQAMLQTIASVKSFVDNGQIRAIATSGAKRSEALPAVPTIDESGVKGFTFSPWYGVFAPPGTPAGVLDRIHYAVNTVLHKPDEQKALAVQGMEADIRSRQQFAELFYSDLDRWTPIIKSMHLKPTE